MSTFPRVVYTCMEFGLREDLRIYSGGLGVLAGDVLKAAGDAQAPLVGLGLFWSEGYVRQRVDSEGRVHDRHELVLRDALEPLEAEVSVSLQGRDVPLRAHVLRGEHAPLYLLEPKREEDAWITRRLYQGRHGDRVAQELLLGVGGMRLLRAIGHDFDVLHLNEGHAVFAALELAREEVAEGASVEEAFARVRRRVVFTTHTPVPAGNEAHDVSLLLEQGADLGTFTREDLERLAGDPFVMTVAGLRLSRRSNAVSQLHGLTAQRMWAHVTGAAPILAVTNGVHVPTWQEPRLREAAESGDPWPVHQELKSELLDAIEERTGRRFAIDRLLVGFARRAAPYKRADLLFGRELPSIAPLLDEGRLQLVFAGQAHPDNAPGKGILSLLADMARRFPRGVVFLDEHDIGLGRLLTRGCDAWLNTPTRPKEACGTSGMKAALNGVLNVSTLDGWWNEACRHGVNGWQVGGGYERAGQDEHDLLDLVRTLKDDVLPTYESDRQRWVAMMRASVESVQHEYSAARMLSEYRDRLYTAD